MTHRLAYETVSRGRCACGSVFQAYRSKRLRSDAQLQDEVLDQYNAHKSALRQQGRGS